MCAQCKHKYGKNKCPFCTKNMKTKSTIIIQNKNTTELVNGDIIMSVMNYNIIRIY